MANFGAKILNNALSSLSAQQAVIATTANNIANVNTEGYTRRQVQLETRTGQSINPNFNVGNGVQVGDLNRIADAFLERLLQDAQSEKGAADVELSMVSRLESLFSLDGTQETIGSTLTSFFTAANDLATNPSSIELRQNFVERGQDLVNAIKVTYNGIAAIQTEADSRIATEINVVNSITTELANLNGRIRLIEGGGNSAADERDKRDVLLKQLAEKMSFDVTELSDGTINVTMKDGGFALVAGSTSRSLEVTRAPSFGTTLPQSLSGGVLSYIVYDFDSTAGRADIDFTQALSQQGGTIGGLLRVRGYIDAGATSPFQADGYCAELATRVETLTRRLLEEFNQVYIGNNAQRALDLDGQVATNYAFFDFNYGGNKNPDLNNFPDDLDDIPLPNFSSLLQLTSTDPRDVAAAWDNTPLAVTTDLSPGDNRNIRAIANLKTQTYNLDFANLTFTGTFEELYTNSVTTVGNIKSRVELTQSVSESKLNSAQAKRDEISAVSLDEEFANLIRYQKAFEASARMIRTADELFELIVGLV